MKTPEFIRWRNTDGSFPSEYYAPKNDVAYNLSKVSGKPYLTQEELIYLIKAGIEPKIEENVHV